MVETLRDLIQDFQTKYLASAEGQAHLRQHSEIEPREVRIAFEEIRAKHKQNADITDDVLRGLLPHIDSSFHRENGYRISTWPAIRKDIRGWFEAIGWKRTEDWEPTARMLFEAIDGVLRGDFGPWDEFIGSDYQYGFGAGLISPILFCLDNQYPVINSKVVKTYAAITTLLGNKDTINAKLDMYFENAEKVKALQAQLVPYGLELIETF